MELALLLLNMVAMVMELEVGFMGLEYRMV